MGLEGMPSSILSARQRTIFANMLSREREERESARERERERERETHTHTSASREGVCDDNIPCKRSLRHIQDVVRGQSCHRGGGGQSCHLRDVIIQIKDASIRKPDQDDVIKAEVACTHVTLTTLSVSNHAKRCTACCTLRDATCELVSAWLPPPKGLHEDAPTSTLCISAGQGTRWNHATLTMGARTHAQQCPHEYVQPLGGR